MNNLPAKMCLRAPVMCLKQQGTHKGHPYGRQCGWGI
ncbi:hypothetical protein BMS3Bbin14_01185 [bacterium BMS3Bbin14]|nr:hypothetical protein BMS3Bbin14_01185 [bacterium BMS3Bbin14]